MRRTRRLLAAALALTALAVLLGFGSDAPGPQPAAARQAGDLYW